MPCNRSGRGLWGPFLALACLLAAGSAVQAAPPGWKLEDRCPGNLIVNGGFETPDPSQPDKFPKAPWNHYNNGWGWFTSVPGWTWTCLRTDWGPVRALEIQRRAVATSPEGMQNLELLPNATGVACQTVTVEPGATYRLSFYYGRLMTYAWRNQYQGQFIKFETKMDAIYRDGSYKSPLEAGQSKGAPYPQDSQGFTRLATADTTQQGEQWQRYEATFKAPASGKVQLAFTTTKRPKECGSCGSLLDAVCLQKV